MAGIAVAGEDDEAATRSSSTNPLPAVDAGSGTEASSSSIPGSADQSEPGSAVMATVPPDADELPLTDGFSDASPAWGDATWEVDNPGEATATVIDGVGVMETDGRGTHEWVRALAPGSAHDDVTLFARITPIRSGEGTVFVGLHGDGEWRDDAPYLPQTGIVVEYAYSEIFQGEIVLIVLDGPDERRIGPVSGPILSDGQSASIRFEAVGGRARAKIWPVGEDEPAGWDVEGEPVSTEGGVVHIAYRDGVGQSVAWNELTLHLWP